MKFHEKTLPLQAQYAPVFTFTPLDYDTDRNQNLLQFGVDQQEIKAYKLSASMSSMAAAMG